MSRLIKIYTDGSSIGNPGPGGYGIVMLVDNDNYKKEFSQGFNLTTNNRMELLAVIVALEKIKIKNSKVKVYTDSKYVSDAVEKGWLFNWVKKDFKNKKNPDLWRRFLDIYNDHEVKFNG
jgi:ribonuclease HI